MISSVHRSSAELSLLSKCQNKFGKSETESTGQLITGKSLDTVTLFRESTISNPGNVVVGRVAERVLCVRAAAPRADGVDGGALEDVARLAQVPREERRVGGRRTRIQVRTVTMIIRGTMLPANCDTAETREKCHNKQMSH